MTKLAAQRDTHLSRAEIAGEALRQFDQGPREPSIRSLAAALKVAPTGIYHHFSSIAAIYQAAVELVWMQAMTRTLELVPNPEDADPADVLVAVGLATRRTWIAHHRLARHMAATPEASQFTTRALGLMAVLFERLGLQGEDAAASFHNYASFMIGAVLFAADRATADEQLTGARNGDGHAERHHARPVDSAMESPGGDTRLSIESVMNLSVDDPARDEALFEQGLRRLIVTFGSTAPSLR